MDDYSLLALAQHDDKLALLDLLDYRCAKGSRSAAGKTDYYRDEELRVIQSLAGLGSHQDLVFLREEEGEKDEDEGWERFWDRQDDRLSSEHRSLWSVEGEDFSAIDGDDESE